MDDIRVMVDLRDEPIDIVMLNYLMFHLFYFSVAAFGHETGDCNEDETF